MKGRTTGAKGLWFPPHPAPSLVMDENGLLNRKKPVPGLHVCIWICKCMSGKNCSLWSPFQLNHRTINARRLPEIYCNYSSNTSHGNDVGIDGAQCITITVSPKATPIFWFKKSFNMLLYSQAAMESSLTYFLGCFYRQNWSIRGRERKKKTGPLISNIVGSLSESRAGL